MLRYRIARDPKGRYFVAPALVGVVPLDQTYSNVEAAQRTADWCNSTSHRDRHRSAARKDATADEACVVLPTSGPVAQ